MNITELEKIASLPAIQDAIRAQAEAIEAESLAMRLGELEEASGSNVAVFGG